MNDIFIKHIEDKRRWEDGQHANDIFKCNSVNENVLISQNRIKYKLVKWRIYASPQLNEVGILPKIH